MSTEILSTDQQEKLINFFSKDVYPERFAQIIRRYNHEMALIMIREDLVNSSIDSKWIDDGFFWLNELAEILDPNLNKEKLTK